ncbi:PREDICTED: protein ARABIDILLO 1-like [Lupinus angustifolius]|uniref:protein ARABIDILLO 1-like n=1 Tax=Lupinus angustifolius TaxID=3871 RepID=UPI00092E31A7|nr:PREDICTED: protein ARABIDILLO 1-like [Lupinus angustifolius]XP_019461074.1 PREDICTED: protein ARABIDILLO 1-like [Lupinus angustifolius]XP_019461075.1 PREDICTED: protein ARABIDILLO 1-like [Lupinus angustifolius]
MSRRVRRKVARRSEGNVVLGGWPEIQDEVLDLKCRGIVDWTSLPDDTVIQLLSCLSYRDRASLSSTCRTWRSLGSSPCLWTSLDILSNRFDVNMASSLSPRCVHLQKLRFRGAESADAIIHLRARNLRELSGDYCRKITDATLAVIGARHELLESLQLGPDFCERITSDAIKAVAHCCPRLNKIRLSGVRDVNADAINALAKHCPKLADIGFIDCLKVDEVALGNVSSLRFLSVAGTSGMKWGVVSNLWHELPNLIGLDVSRTDIGPSVVARLLASSQNLRILCALNCPILEEDASFSASKYKNKLLISLFTDIFKGLGSLFFDATYKGKNVFLDWRNSNKNDKELNEIIPWLEWMLSHTLLRSAESPQQGLNNFWVEQGAALLLSLMQSSQEDVQERAATGLATFVVIDDENARIDCGRAEAVMRNGGIHLLLGLAKSWREGLQSEAAKAIANLSVNANVAKAVAEEGGIDILAGLARSTNKLVAEEAAGGLWNLSAGEEHKGAIAEAGGIQALVDLIFKWSSSGDGVLERAAGALANLAADDKCSTEVAAAGGVHALVMLARNCKFEGVQEQAARALANLAAHGDSNSNNAAVGQEAGALEALVQLTRSTHEGVSQEAAGALWNLSFDDRNREAIAAAGGVQALVALAQSCSNASTGLQERAAGALWGLSASEANSIAIGREGGVAPLVSLARSEVEDVHETAAGALWNLAFNPGNALRIVEEGGVSALVYLCSSSVSKMARFMAALALAYMFDGRMDEFATVGTSLESTSKSVSLDGARRTALKNIEAFVLKFSDTQAFAAAAASSAPAALAQVTEGARIQEAGHLRCSGAEIGRFVTMLRSPSSTLKACAAFALLQFTIPGGRHATHHASLMQNAGAARVLRSAAAAATAPLEAKIFARIVLRNLEHHQIEYKV